MKKGSTLILKLAIVLIGLAVLALCIFALPSAWGAVRLEFPEFPSVSYASHLIILGMYVTTIPFYIGLYQGLKLLTFIDKNTAFSEASVKALRNIKLCAFLIGAIYLAGVPLLFPLADADDAPGVLPIGFIIACVPIVVSIFSAVLERLLRSAIDMKSENDLTV